MKFLFSGYKNPIEIKFDFMKYSELISAFEPDDKSPFIVCEEFKPSTILNFKKLFEKIQYCIDNYKKLSSHEFEELYDESTKNTENLKLINFFKIKIDKLMFGVEEDTYRYVICNNEGPVSEPTYTIRKKLGFCLSLQNAKKYIKKHIIDYFKEKKYIDKINDYDKKIRLDHSIRNYKENEINFGSFPKISKGHFKSKYDKKVMKDTELIYISFEESISSWKRIYTITKTNKRTLFRYFPELFEKKEYVEPKYDLKLLCSKKPTEEKKEDGIGTYRRITNWSVLKSKELDMDLNYYLYCGDGRRLLEYEIESFVYSGFGGI